MEGNWGVAIFSLILGALLGGLVRVAENQYSIFKESQGIADALRAEMETILEIIAQRGYVNLLTTKIQTLQNPHYQASYQDVLSISILQDYFTVFNSVSSKIGLLPGLGGRIVRFYNLTKSVIEDVNDFREIHKNAIMGLVGVVRQGLLDRYLETLGILQILQSLGRETISELKHHSAQSFLWSWKSEKQSRPTG